MAKNGFQLIDAEMHVMEPVDLWERYIDPEFSERAPRRLDERRWDIRTMVEGEVMAAMPGGDWPALTDAEEKALAERYAEEIARNFCPESQVRAMDKEGLDLAILFPTSAMYVTAFTKMDPRFAAAACRVYNDWLHDYIQALQPPLAAWVDRAGRSPASSARSANAFPVARPAVVATRSHPAAVDPTDGRPASRRPTAAAGAAAIRCAGHAPHRTPELAPRGPRG